MQLEIKDDSVLIRYEKSVDVTTILKQKSIYIEVIAISKPIKIKTTDVKVIDLESLQLLLSFIISAKKKNISVRWEQCSEEFINLATLLGFSDVLKIEI